MNRIPLLAGCLAVLTGCQHDLPDLPDQMVPEPAAAEVESVVFLVGDAGDAIEGRSPLLRRLQAGVGHGPTGLQRDTSVVVLFLGDNVYPDGMDRPDEPAYERDSTVLQGQVNAVGGEWA